MDLNENTKSNSDNFLTNNEALRNIDFPNVDENKIGNDFFTNNETLNNIELPNITRIGDSFSLDDMEEHHSKSL